MLTIRRLTPDDWSSLRTIRLRALTEAPQVYGTVLAQVVDQDEESWRSGLTDPQSSVFVGFGPEGPAALAGLRVNGGGNTRHRGVIWGVFVDAAHRGSGQARQLITALLDHADTIPGLEFCELNVASDNAPALSLYEGLGFRIVGTIPRALKHAGGYSDEHMMVRPVPAR